MDQQTDEETCVLPRTPFEVTRLPTVEIDDFTYSDMFREQWIGIRSDHAEFYSLHSLTWLAGGVGVAGLMANTGFDEHFIRDAYVDNIVLAGYARVSTDDQDLSLQIDALTRQGIPQTAIFTDKLSGAKPERPGLTKCLETLQRGDILVVWRLDRLGRSMRHLITLVEDLRNKAVGFRSLNEGVIDTTCASGELIFNIFSALAQFERRLIQERTKAGLAAARARGRNGGRPKLAADDTKVVLAKKLHADKSLEIDDICKTLRMSRSTFYRYVRL